MSMNSYPCHGYVVKVDDFLKQIPKDRITELQLAIDDNDEEAITKVLNETVLKGVGFNIFHLGDEDFCEGLPYGEALVSIDQEELFAMTPTPLMDKLTKDGLKPEENAWTIWG